VSRIVSKLKYRLKRIDVEIALLERERAEINMLIGSPDVSKIEKYLYKSLHRKK